MNFWRLSFDLCIDVAIFASLFKISSIVFLVSILSLDSVSCAANVVVLCVVANSSSAMMATYYNGCNFYMAFFCSSFIFATSLYSCMLDNIIANRSIGAHVFIHSVAYNISSYLILILSSNDCSYGWVVSSVQMRVHVSHIFMNSCSNVLIFSTVVYTVLSVWEFSSSCIHGGVCTSNSMIFMQRTLIASLILTTCSSIVSSITIDTSSTSLYNFWMTAWTFCAICSTSSFSFKALVTFVSTSNLLFKDFSAFPSASLLSVLDFSTYPSASLFSFSACSTCCSIAHFSYSTMVYCFYSSTLSMISFSNSVVAVSTQIFSSYVIPTCNPYNNSIGISETTRST